MGMTTDKFKVFKESLSEIQELQAYLSMDSRFTESFIESLIDRLLTDLIKEWKRSRSTPVPPAAFDRTKKLL